MHLFRYSPARALADSGRTGCLLLLYPQCSCCPLLLLGGPVDAICLREALLDLSAAGSGEASLFALLVNLVRSEVVGSACGSGPWRAQTTMPADCNGPSSNLGIGRVYRYTHESTIDMVGMEGEEAGYWGGIVKFS